jgi:hypothetical protein
MPSISQIEIDKTIIDFLGDTAIKTQNDLVTLRNRLQNALEFRPYKKETQKHADGIQWKRTASEILRDGYVYKGKACSDLTIVFLSLCKAAGIDGQLVKLRSIDKKKTHSIAEVKLSDSGYRLDIASKDSVPFKGRLTDDSVWNKEYKAWKKGRDVWDLGLRGIEHAKEK